MSLARMASLVDGEARLPPPGPLELPATGWGRILVLLVDRAAEASAPAASPATTAGFDSANIMFGGPGLAAIPEKPTRPMIVARMFLSCRLLLGSYGAILSPPLASAPMFHAPITIFAAVLASATYMSLVLPVKVVNASLAPSLIP